MTPDQIEQSFTYHPPQPSQIPRYETMRSVAREFAKLIGESCPVSAERTLAIRKVQEAVMWANASIAINES